MIYVTVGTMFMDFPRLINAVDKIALETGEKVIVQRGMGETIPQHCEHFTFKPRADVLDIQREARVIVAHAGIGCAIDALTEKRPLIVVPRRKALNEHMDDHQLQIAQAIDKRRWGRMVADVANLAAAVADPPPVPEEYRTSSHRLDWAVRDAVDRVAARKR